MKEIAQIFKGMYSKKKNRIDKRIVKNLNILIIRYIKTH